MRPSEVLACLRKTAMFFIWVWETHICLIPFALRVDELRAKPPKPESWCTLCDDPKPPIHREDLDVGNSFPDFMEQCLGCGSMLKCASCFTTFSMWRFSWLSSGLESLNWSLTFSQRKVICEEMFISLSRGRVRSFLFYQVANIALLTIIFWHVILFTQLYLFVKTHRTVHKINFPYINFENF